MSWRRSEARFEGMACRVGQVAEFLCSVQEPTPQTDVLPPGGEAAYQIECVRDQIHDLLQKRTRVSTLFEAGTRAFYASAF